MQYIFSLLWEKKQDMSNRTVAVPVDNLGPWKRKKKEKKMLFPFQTGFVIGTV